MNAVTIYGLASSYRAEFASEEAALHAHGRCIQVLLDGGGQIKEWWPGRTVILIPAPGRGRAEVCLDLAAPPECPLDLWLPDYMGEWNEDD